MTKFACVSICSINYIAKAMVLIDSYLDHHQEHNFYLILVDKKSDKIIIEREGLKIIWVEDLKIPNFAQYAFMYDVIELNTNVKPFAMKMLLQSHDAVIYLDPDIKVYSPLNVVFEALKNSSLVITPHYNTPILDGFKPDDIELMKFGAFNLGFVAVANCKEGISFLDWWSDRCLNCGFYEPQAGLAVDQKWVGLSPCFFPSMKVLHDIGLNLAFWNLHERYISKKDNGFYVNDVVPLKFIHFSSFDVKNPEAIAHKQNRYSAGSRPDFSVLCVEYAKNLLDKSNNNFMLTKYGFDFFENGAYITPALRRFYAALKNTELGTGENPFDAKGNVYVFASKNGFLLKNNKPSARHTFQDMNKYGLQITVLNKVFKIILLIFGPEKYFNLMRYLAYFSSIRNQADLFNKLK